MELILWRHAEAELRDTGRDDHDRVLTAKGHKQAWKMAEWLDALLPGTCRILVSPAARTIQTAEALGRKFKISPELGTESTPERILAAVQWPARQAAVLVIGHQPALGQIAAQLISGTRQQWPIRKAGVWWITQRNIGSAEDEQVETILRAVMAPDLVGKMGRN